EYIMDERNSFTLTENLNIRDFRRSGTADYTRNSSLGTRMGRQIRETDTRSFSNSLSSSLDYKHKFLREKQELTANVTYVYSSNDREQEYITSDYDKNDALVSGPVLQNAPGSGGNNSLNAQADYTMPVAGLNGR